LRQIRFRYETKTMDRVAAMLFLLAVIVTTAVLSLAFFSICPLFSTCITALLYVLFYFLANESSGVHHAQEFENRFWTIWSALLAVAIIYVPDSPVYFEDLGPYVGPMMVLTVGYGVHTWDRIVHRKEMNRQIPVGLRRGASAAQSLVRLNAMGGMSIEEQLNRISNCMKNIDQMLVPSTINNFINQQYVMRQEREIISIFEDAQPKALNYLIGHVKLGLIFYKIKDHRSYRGQHRTELIELLAVDRVSVLSIVSRVSLLSALQLMKLPANNRAEHWVRNIILSTHQDDLSELKTMNDSHMDYYCMTKLIYEDIRSETIRRDILDHFRKEAAVQNAHMEMGTRKSKLRMQKAWRKILSDVDDTLTSSGGSYPAGVDKRYPKKVVYPGVIGLYREMDLGINGPEKMPSNTGNLVFLSARPHLYKDISEKHNFAKFKKLREREGVDGRGGLHTTPSLLAGDITSGREFMMTNDFEPLARKKFDNFKKYVSIYPEFKHVFICDNGQGDVRAGELVHDSFPNHLDGLFVHVVQDMRKTYGFDAERWRKKGLTAKTCFFTSYPDAALFAATRTPPLIRMSGLFRVCQDAIIDFDIITKSQKWSSSSQKRDRMSDLNQSLWRCNQTLNKHGEPTVPLIESSRQWEDGEKVRTLYGIGTIRGFDPVFDLYDVELDWRPLDLQLREHNELEAKNTNKKDAESRGQLRPTSSKATDRSTAVLSTVVEEDESNYLSPSTSFETSKHSSKQSLPDQTLLSIPSAVEEEKSSMSSPTSNSHSRDEFSFDASVFERLDAVSPEPTLDETTGTMSTADDIGATKSKVTTSSSTDVPISVTTSISSHQSKRVSNGRVMAKIQGRFISRYTPPSLPKLHDKRSKLSFWGGESNKEKSDKPDLTKSRLFSAGDKVSTPYGQAVVVEHRHKSKIVVVDFIGWTSNLARAYIQESVIKREGSSFLGSILRSFSSAGDKPGSPVKKTSSAEKQFPHVTGTKMYTPFGEGIVTRPIPVMNRVSSSNSLASLNSLTSLTSIQKSKQESSGTNTMAISITSWTMGNGRHPTLFCTVDRAKEWKIKKNLKVASHTRENSLLSALGSLVSGTVESLSKKIRVPREIEAPKIEAVKYERYYKDGAAVTTAYGDGTVRSFRESDGFYTVSLLTKSGKAFATAHLQEDSMSYRLAKGCVEGYPVLTKFGLSGVLQSVNPTTGVHNVFVPSCGAICYLQPDQVIRPIKAAVSEDVSTQYGEGKVMKYRLQDDAYEIRLTWGNAMLYAKAATFDRIDDRMEDKGGFGMGWILKFFYSREESKDDGAPRSRSNSVSMLSQSGRSVKSAA